MFRIVWSFLGRRDALSAGQGDAGSRLARSSRLDQVAPVMVPGQADTGASSVIFREPVLDRRARICGYEFALQGRLHSRFMNERALARRVHDELLIRSLVTASVADLLRERLVFVEMSPAISLNPLLQSLPARNTVIVLAAPHGSAMDPLQMRSHASAIRERGFRVAWHFGTKVTELPPELLEFDFLRIDASRFDGLELRDLTRELRSLAERRGTKLVLLASRVQTADEFQLCFHAGFDFFQGAFVDTREHWHPPRTDVNRIKVIQILNRLRSGAEADELARALRQDAVLTYKLLRYINSPSMGLRKQIIEVEQALALLGREKLYRWLSLLLYDVRDAGYAETAVFEQALVRARLMEQLALCSDFTPDEADQIFMTGLFSLLDRMLGESITQILSRVAVGPPVREALLKETGPYAPLLKLSAACELGDPGVIESIASECGVDTELLNRELLGALQWADEVREMTV